MLIRNGFANERLMLASNWSRRRVKLETVLNQFKNLGHLVYPLPKEQEVEVLKPSRQQLRDYAEMFELADQDKSAGVNRYELNSYFKDVGLSIDLILQRMGISD